MAISITDATDSNSNVLAGKFGSHTGDLKYKAIEFTFDSSYPTGGESLTPGMVGGFDDIINIIIEPSDGRIPALTASGQHRAEARAALRRVP